MSEIHNEAVTDFTDQHVKKSEAVYFSEGDDGSKLVEQENTSTLTNITESAGRLGKKFIAVAAAVGAVGLYAESYAEGVTRPKSTTTIIDFTKPTSMKETVEAFRKANEECATKSLHVSPPDYRKTSDKNGQTLRGSKVKVNGFNHNTQIWTHKRNMGACAIIRTLKNDNLVITMNPKDGTTKGRLTDSVRSNTAESTTSSWMWFRKK